MRERSVGDNGGGFDGRLAKAVSSVAPSTLGRVADAEVAAAVAVVAVAVADALTAAAAGAGAASAASAGAGASDARGGIRGVGCGFVCVSG